MTLAELMEKRARLVTEMRQMHDKVKKEERGFNADEEQRWNAIDADVEALNVKIEREEKLEKREGFLAQSTGTVAGQQADPEQRSNQGTIDEANTFRSWLTGGMDGLSIEQRQFMAARLNTNNEIRALAAGTGNAGGYTVAQDFMNRLEVAMKMWGGMLEVSEIIRTDTGATLPMPTLNFTSLVATIIGENAQSSTDSSTPFGVVNLGAYTYRTPVLPISYEFLQDSAFNEQVIINAFAESLGRGVNAHLTTGTGTSQPKGIVTASASGKVGATGQTTSITYDDIVDLEHSVDPAYRAAAKFMFHDSTLKAVKKIKDANNLPIFVPAVAGPASDTILGYQYQINQDMAVMGANAKSVLFGRLDKYKTRIVKDMAMLRLTERYADYLQVGFLGYMRIDGNLLDAGTNPVKFYQNSAT